MSDWQPIDTAPKDGTVIQLTWMDNGAPFEIYPMRWGHIQRNGLFPGTVGMWVTPDGSLTWNGAPDGREVFVNADEVMMIGASGGWNVGGCATEVLVHDKMICVVEAPSTVKKLVEGAKR